MRDMDGTRPAWRAVTVAALLTATPVLAACGGDPAPAGEPMPHVATFKLGWDTPEERTYVLTPPPGPRVDVVHPLPVEPPPDLKQLEQVGPEQVEQGVREEHQAPSSTPRAYEPGAGFMHTVAWVNDGRYLGIVTWGSGSCPNVPYGIRTITDQEIEVELGDLYPGADICSADLSGYVTVVELLDGVSPALPLTARFDGHEMTIEPAGA